MFQIWHRPTLPANNVYLLRNTFTCSLLFFGVLHYCNALVIYCITHIDEIISVLSASPLSKTKQPLHRSLNNRRSKENRIIRESDSRYTFITCTYTADYISLCRSRTTFPHNGSGNRVHVFLVSSERFLTSWFILAFLCFKSKYLYHIRRHEWSNRDVVGVCLAVWI